MDETTQLMAPLIETAAQTAPRVRRRLRQAFPGAEFRVRSDALSQTVTVSWDAGPNPEQVEAIIAPHCAHRSPAGGTLWSSEQRTLSVVKPRAVIRLMRDGQAADVDHTCPPF